MVLIIEQLQVRLDFHVDSPRQLLHLHFKELESDRLDPSMEIANAFVDQIIVWESVFDHCCPNASRRYYLIIEQVHIAEDGSPSKLQRIVNQNSAERTLPTLALSGHQHSRSLFPLL